MVESTASSKHEGKSRSITDLLLWLALLPFIFGTLFCSGQLALLYGTRFSPMDTSSRLTANYLPWPYDLIPAINLAALIQDLERDERAMGNPIEPEVVVQGTFWVPPTPTGVNPALATKTPFVLPTATLTPTLEPPEGATPTAVKEATASRTLTSVPSSTPLPTALPTLTATRTATSTVFIPSPTHTQPPEKPDTPTATLAPTKTFTATVTRTPTYTPTRAKTNTPAPTLTFTPTFTNTPVPPPTNTFTPTVEVIPTDTFTPTPGITPVYVPVIPLAENDGVSEFVSEGVCRASFGYRNDNVMVVDIPVGARNTLSEPEENLSISPGLPTTFLADHISGAFTVEWTSSQNMVWTLDGRSAVAYWCIP